MRPVKEDFPPSKVYVYMNTAAISLKPIQVIKAISSFEETYEISGTINDNFEDQVLEEARDEVSNLINCKSDDIAIVTNTSEGLNFTAHAVKMTPGSNIVTTDLEFPTVTYPWLKVAEEKRLEVRFARHKNGIVTIEDLERLVDDKTKVITLSHVEYSSGFRFNLREVAELAHKHGALLVVDAIQSLGVIPFDAKVEDVDVLVTAAYKWLLGPFGAGFLYMKDEVYHDVEPIFAGWRSKEDHEVFEPLKLSFKKTARKFEYGGMPYSAIYGFTRSLKYISDLEVDNINNHVIGITQELMEGLKNLGANLFTPFNRHQRAGIVTAKFDNLDADTLLNELKEEKIIISKRFGALRFSPHIYNNKEDVEKVIHLIKKVIEQSG
ncbi:MAG: aminotransferase class V-fold PLP-dependent enzyme [Nitrososphaeria archaeon]